MKIRTDYVTNSSSSSFILAFKDEEDLNKFKEYCDFLNFEEFLNLVEERGMDCFYIYNNKDEKLKLNVVLDYIEQFSLPFEVKKRIYELRAKDLEIDFSYTIPINKFGEKNIDIDSLKDIEIDNDDFEIEIKKGDTSKEEALKLLEFSYVVDLKRDLINNKFNSRDYESYSDYLADVDKYENSKEFKDIVNKELLTNEEYLEKKEKLINSKYIFNTEIWDTNGGLLEWSIRNGFVEDNFYDNHILTWNVG